MLDNLGPIEPGPQPGQYIELDSIVRTALLAMLIARRQNEGLGWWGLRVLGVMDRICHRT